jgi:hypothetical protein
MVVDLPFSQTNLSINVFIREFEKSVNSQELVWHRDRKTRRVRVLSGEGWFLQLDNELPIRLEENKQYEIEAKTYHRLLKTWDCSNLIVKIEELQ